MLSPISITPVPSSSSGGGRVKVDRSSCGPLTWHEEDTAGREPCSQAAGMQAAGPTASCTRAHPSGRCWAVTWGPCSLCLMLAPLRKQRKTKRRAVKACGEVGMSRQSQGPLPPPRDALVLGRPPHLSACSPSLPSLDARPGNRSGSAWRTQS